MWDSTSLSFGGYTASELAEEFGLPLYVYDASVIERQYKTLDTAFSGIRHTIKYACKALNNISIIRYIRSLGAGLDAVSPNEIQLALKAGFAPEEIMFTPNCISFEELEEAIRLGVSINIDNLPLLQKLGQKYGSSVPVCLRINPNILAGGNLKISTGHKDSKFGISIDQLQELIHVVSLYSINIVGVHIHTGSEIADTGIIKKGAEVLAQVAEHFPDVYYFDFGGGLKVSYKPGDKAADIEGIASCLIDMVNTFGKNQDKQMEIWLEPGKFLVSEAGVFLARVNVIKQTPTRTFAGLDTGLNHLIRPMFYDAYHHIINAGNPGGKPMLYTVCGYICETDNFAWDREIAEIREGDILAFCNAGAYGFTMASQYNARPRPAEVFIVQGKAYLIRKRESFEDLLHNQIELPIFF